jgi:hypothetical protein
MNVALSALLLLASTNGTAAPAGSTEAAPATTSAPKAKEERKICKRVDMTGARTAAKKVCMTAEQWRKADLDGF